MNNEIFEAALASLPPIFRTEKPFAGLLLGSGWNQAVNEMRILAEVPYREIPGFGGATVIGHSGRLLLCEEPAHQRRFLAFCGRRHWYEGCDWESIVMPAILTQRLGAGIFVATNAAGGIRDSLKPGDVVILNDHIRLSPLTPLRGEHNPLFGPRFPDQSHVYDPALRELLHEAGNRQGMELTEGVYALACGPCYETPAEIRAYKILGADLVGMSTVPETMVASAIGLRVAGMSFVSNMAAGISGQFLDGNDVIETSKRHAERLSRLVCAFVNLLADIPA